MCFDEGILSAYFDGELKPEWASLMEKHLSQCERCRGRIDGYGRLRVTMSDAPAANIDSLKTRTWHHIQDRLIWPQRRESLWRRTLRVPAPVALAVAVSVIGLSLGLAYSLRGDRPPRIPEGVTAGKLIGSEISSFEELKRFLQSGESDLELVITLPIKPRLRITSEPQLIREADYIRQ